MLLRQFSRSLATPRKSGPPVRVVRAARDLDRQHHPWSDPHRYRGSGKPLSANRSARGPAAAALYQVCTKPEAGADWNEQIDGSHGLGLFNDAGHGLIVDGTPEELLASIDQVHAHVHQKLR